MLDSLALTGNKQTGNKPIYRMVVRLNVLIPITLTWKASQSRTSAWYKKFMSVKDTEWWVIMHEFKIVLLFEADFSVLYSNTLLF